MTKPIKGKLGPVVYQSLETFYRWMKQKRYSDSTINTYGSLVRQFFQRTGLQPDRITVKEIENYNFEYFINIGQSYATQNQWINAIKLYLKVTSDQQFDLSAIERPHRQRKLPNVLDRQEVQALFHNTLNIKHRALLMLVYGAGLRIGEALNLTLEDIRSQESLIYIPAGKGKKDRRVPLSMRLLEELRRYYKSYRPRKYLFEGARGGKYTSSSAAKVLKRAAKRAGIKRNVTLHTLRHSYATHLTNSGVNIQYLQQILGHNSPKTTMIYTHLSGKDIRKVKSPLDDLDL